MDGERFDALVHLLGRGATRRGVLALLAGGIGLAPLAASDTAARKKKRKKKTKKPHRCVTVGNLTVTCPKGRVCCDPAKSTGAGCAPAGYPVCCESDGFAHERDVVCCASSTEGDEGVCFDEYPHCCPESIGGCCVDGYPLCCSNALGEYCCPLGTICCESDPETGCCEDALSLRAAAGGGARRGAWKPRLEGRSDAGAYTPIGRNRS